MDKKLIKKWDYEINKWIDRNNKWNHLDVEDIIKQLDEDGEAIYYLTDSYDEDENLALHITITYDNSLEFDEVED